MFVSMHQPDYLPWLGYFNKIAVSDKFIFFDTADFSDGGFHERNKIRTNSSVGWSYLTIPMPHVEYFKPLKDAKLPANQTWSKKHWRSLQVHYGRAPYWKDFSPFFEQLYAGIAGFQTLGGLNMAIIKYFCRAFGLKAEFFRASEFEFSSELKSTEAILAVIKQVGATTFLAGPSGKNYLNRQRFAEEGVELLFQDYHTPQYAQLFSPFISGLSALDLLFNEGPKSIDYLK